MMFHRHKWSEVARKAVPGLLEIGRSFDGYVSDKDLYGFTTIEQRCTQCNEVKIAIYPGSMNKTPEVSGP